MAANRLSRNTAILTDVVPTVRRHRFLLTLLLIMIAAAALRAPGVVWLQDVAPEPNFTFHPDERRFIRWAADFEHKPPVNYVLGMTTHLYILKEFARLVLGATIDLVITLRIVSLAYAVLLVGLVGLMVRSITSSAELALLTAVFLTLAPVHIIPSHFGTSDATAVFYFCLACFSAWYFATTRSNLAFLLCAAAIGITLAVKFFASLVVLFIMIIIIYDQQVQRFFTGSLVAAISFLAANFFSLTPWDFARFIRLLIFDNIVVTGGNDRIDNIIYYPHATVSALGLGAAVCLAIGLGVTAVAIGRYLRPGRAALPSSFVAVAKHPTTILAVPFVVHLYFMLGLEVSSTRHLLPLAPALCLGAAVGFAALTRKLGGSRPATLAVALVIFGYQTYNAVGVERMFQHDVRRDAATWIADNVGDNADVATFMEYSQVRGVRMIDEEASSGEVESDFFVTSDLEYRRYFRSDSADEIVRAFGGQQRLEFFRDLFANRAGYTPVAQFSPRTFTIEQVLIEKSFLKSLDTFTPRRYIIFRKSEGDI